MITERQGTGCGFGGFPFGFDGGLFVSVTLAVSLESENKSWCKKKYKKFL
jgi:hypothetical protein